jgi:sugar phosphate permease
MVASLVVESYGLKTTWIVIGLMVLVISVAPSLLLVADGPEDVGLLPDGDEPAADAARKMSPTSAFSEVEKMTSEEDSWSLSDAVRSGTFWLLILMGFACYFVHTSIGVHMGAYFRDIGLGATSAALAVSVSWIVSAIGSLVWGWVTDRIQVRYAYCGMFLFQAGSTLYLMFTGGTAGVFLASALFGVVSAGSNVVPSVIYANYFGRSSLGKIRGLGEVGVLLGQGTGPVIAGVLFSLQGGYDTIFAVFIVLALGCSLLALKARPPARAAVLNA